MLKFCWLGLQHRNWGAGGATKFNPEHQQIILRSASVVTCVVFLVAEWFSVVEVDFV